MTEPPLSGSSESPQDPDAPDQARKPRRRRWWHVPRFLRNGLVVGILFLLVWYIVIPEFFANSKSIHAIEHVNVLVLLAGGALEVLSLFAFAKLTIVVLPENSISVWKAWRINLASLAAGHLMPGGTAGGTGLSIRLLTNEGISGADVGFATATMGIGSAVLLNAILWLALLVSIPLNGFRAVYVWVALASLILLGFFASLIAGFAKGDGWAVRLLRRLAIRFRFIPEETLERLVKRIADQIQAFWRDQDLVRRGLIWATSNWLLDAGCLWVCLFAFHVYLNPIDLLVAYGVGNVLGAIPITPGGLGIVEGSTIGLLEAFGVSQLIAVAAVFGWRFFNFWLPIPVGGGCYVSLRAARGTRLRELIKAFRGRRSGPSDGDATAGPVVPPVS